MLDSGVIMAQHPLMTLKINVNLVITVPVAHRYQ